MLTPTSLYPATMLPPANMLTPLAGYGGNLVRGGNMYPPHCIVPDRSSELLVAALQKTEKEKEKAENLVAALQQKQKEKENEERLQSVAMAKAKADANVLECFHISTAGLSKWSISSVKMWGSYISKINGLFIFSLNNNNCKITILETCNTLDILK